MLSSETACCTPTCTGHCLRQPRHETAQVSAAGHTKKTRRQAPHHATRTGHGQPGGPSTHDTHGTHRAHTHGTLTAHTPRTARALSTHTQHTHSTHTRHTLPARHAHSAHTPRTAHAQHTAHTKQLHKVKGNLEIRGLWRTHGQFKNRTFLMLSKVLVLNIFSLF